MNDTADKTYELWNLVEGLRGWQILYRRSTHNNIMSFWLVYSTDIYMVWFKCLLELNVRGTCTYIIRTECIALRYTYLFLKPLLILLVLAKLDLQRSISLLCQNITKQYGAWYVLTVCVQSSTCYSAHTGCIAIIMVGTICDKEKENKTWSLESPLRVKSWV